MRLRMMLSIGSLLAVPFSRIQGCISTWSAFARLLGSCGALGLQGFREYGGQRACPPKGSAAALTRRTLIASVIVCTNAETPAGKASNSTQSVSRLAWMYMNLRTQLGWRVRTRRKQCVRAVSVPCGANLRRHWERCWNYIIPSMVTSNEIRSTCSLHGLLWSWAHSGWNAVESGPLPGCVLTCVSMVRTQSLASLEMRGQGSLWKSSCPFRMESCGGPRPQAGMLRL